MKTSRLESANGFPRHLRQNRLLRKLLKAHHAATYDPPPASHPVQHPVQHATKCEQEKEIAERMVPDIHITPPPSYHEIPRSAPAVREVPRFRPTIHDPDPHLRAAHSVASLGSTILTNVPLLSGLDEMDLRRCPSASTLLPPTTYQAAAPLRHHRSADNLLSRHSSSGPTTLPPASPLSSHPVDPSSPPTEPDHQSAAHHQQQRRRRAAKPPSLKRATSYPLISVSIMTPIREEPRSPRPGALTTAASPRRLPSILRPAPSSRHRLRPSPKKRVRFSLSSDSDSDSVSPASLIHHPQYAQHHGQLTFLFATAAVASLLLFLFAVTVADDCVAGLAWAWRWSARLEYAVAFAVGCGVAHWLVAAGVGLGVGAGIDDVVGGTLARAREEGWC
ncbi:uncharacterized protein BKCO1_5800011 [Diplodia corticola]|uniref:Uncharacterized protein n=1 Tax=Diplodia corticola TaxID=236234 RepID=A0A1J9QQA9_9PEZI|nr:uncharacterized protein BKCO1_5800011 [Diplodia corticola]OJD30641.1 hypothetical protein BKCO1_5800011 [Diplodia corticola]